MRKALISVSNKGGIVELGKGLADLGIEILSTGGTARALREEGVPVVSVESVTGFPEILGGRVKTLHPAIHGGILARREKAHLDELDSHNISPIDLVVVNLYPFEATVAKEGVTVGEAVEEIDIGGVTLIRAAAKNFAAVSVVVDPADYEPVLEELRGGGEVSLATRRRLARKAFDHTAGYDAAISAYMESALREEDEPQFPSAIHLNLRKVGDLRYGENPHQSAALYRVAGESGLPDAEVLHGKALSFNNYLDLQAAWSAALDFDQPAAVVIKHSNPCGLATADTLVQAYQWAHESDPVSAFGSVVAFNREVDVATAETIGGFFVEAIIAPGYADEALNLLKRKADRRLLQLPMPEDGSSGWDMRRIKGGMVLQDFDEGPSGEQWEVVTKRSPTEDEARSLRFVWEVGKHVKSNSIVLARGTRTVGVGAGQMSRVDAARIAVFKAGDRSKGTVVASDAFFPFPDAVEVVCEAGATAIIQPGGSKRDSEAIAAADKYGAAMVLTRVRHFRH